MSEQSLPSSRAFITSIIESLATEANSWISGGRQCASTSTNPLKDASPKIRSLLLTLHVLFPNELLPALDVLDRQLVTRLRLKDSKSSTSRINDAEGIKDASTLEENAVKVYFVRSAQQPRHHHGSSSARFSNPMNTWYEVRLSAWNCSCPAFAFGAFPAAIDLSTGASGHPAANAISSDKQAWNFGGLSLHGTPICKHLLACVLIEKCPALFRDSLEVKQVSREEYAGWCAGWGG